MTSAWVLIDTSAWIYTLGASPTLSLRARVQELVLSNQAAISDPVFYELLRGTRNLTEAERLKSRLQSLHPLPFLPTDWSDCAAWTARLARRGLTVKSMDALIAFKAHQQSLTLLHADRDFDRIANYGALKVESWVDRIKGI